MIVEHANHTSDEGVLIDRMDDWVQVTVAIEVKAEKRNRVMDIDAHRHIMDNGSEILIAKRLGIRDGRHEEIMTAFLHVFKRFKKAFYNTYMITDAANAAAGGTSCRNRVLRMCCIVAIGEAILLQNLFKGI